MFPRGVPTASPWALAALLAIAATTAPSGCAAAPRDASGVPAASADPVGEVPADLAIEIRVAPGRLVGEQARVEERAARFVLLPDGTLYGELDRVPAEGRRPARVRRLSREQMVDVWTAFRSAGFADPALADGRGNPALLTPGAEEILATLEVESGGERAVFVRRYRAGEDVGSAIRRAIRVVAALAWASDEPRAETLELPQRYDLGPDPYARFAQPAPGGSGR
jgi:hypothetical protein